MSLDFGVKILIKSKVYRSPTKQPKGLCLGSGGRTNNKIKSYKKWIGHFLLLFVITWLISKGDSSCSSQT